LSISQINVTIIINCLLIFFSRSLSKKMCPIRHYPVLSEWIFWHHISSFPENFKFLVLWWIITWAMLSYRIENKLNRSAVLLDTENFWYSFYWDRLKFIFDFILCQEYCIYRQKVNCIFMISCLGIKWDHLHPSKSNL